MNDNIKLQLDLLREEYRTASPERRTEILQEVERIKGSGESADPTKTTPTPSRMTVDDKLKLYQQKVRSGEFLREGRGR